MDRRFFIFVVFASAIQNSLSTSTRNQTEIMSDYSKIEAFKKVAHSEYQKGVDIAFNSLKDLACMACQDQSPSEESSLSKNTSATQILVALNTQLEVTLLAIQTINPEAYSTIPTVRKTGSVQIQIFVDSVFEGLTLLQSNKSSGNLGKIDALESKSVSAYLVLNAAIFDLFRFDKNNMLKTEVAVEIAQKKTADKLTIGIKSLYTGIRAVLIANTSGTQPEDDSVLFVIENTRNRASLALKSAVEIEFGLIYNFLVSLYIIQMGVAIDPSVIQATTPAASCDNEKVRNRKVCTTTQDGSTEVTPEIDDGMTADSVAIDEAENLTMSEFQRAISLIFAQINANIDNGIQCESEDDSSMTDISQSEGYIAFETGIAAYFDAILIAQPEAFRAVASVQNATFSALLNAVGGILSGIQLICEKDSTKIPAKIESIQSSTIHEASDVVVNVYTAIRNAQESRSQTGAAIERAREKAIFFIMEDVRVIFVGIKILLAQVFPEYQFDGEDCFSSIEAVENKAYSLIAQTAKFVYVGIRILFNASSNNQIEMEEDSCAYICSGLETKCFDSSE